MNFLQPVFWVVILLGVMILIHELGHFWAALAVGVRVETFSIGFGPRLFGFKRGDTDFRVSAILFGGYVRMLGEQPGDAQAADPRSFQAKSRWQRAIVIVAGPLMNVLLAVGLVTGLYMFAYPKEVDTTDPTITAIAPNSPAAQAGLQTGDKIVEVNGKQNPNWEYVLTQEALNANHSIPVTVLRNGRTIATHVTPRMDQKQGIGDAGWSGELDVQVGTVQKDSPAQAAGLQQGDVFMRVNGQPVASAATIRQAVFHSNGKPVQFQLMRQGEMRTVSVAAKATGDPKTPWLIGITFRMPVQFVKLGTRTGAGRIAAFQPAECADAVPGARELNRAARFDEIGIRADRNRADVKRSGAARRLELSLPDGDCQLATRDFQSAADPDPRRRDAADADHRDADAARDEPAT